MNQGETIDVTIRVKDEYNPIFLTHYALKSASDVPERDPKEWQLFAVSDSGEILANLHEQNDNKFEKWTSRWQWREW